MSDTNKYFNDSFAPTQPTFGKGSDYDVKPEALDIPPLIRTKETGDKIYFVKGGIRYWITSPEVLTKLGFKFGDEKFITRQQFSLLRAGEPLKIENIDQFVAPSEASLAEGSDKEANEGAIVLPAHESQFERLSDESIASIPKTEPEKGFTSIIIPVHYNSYSLFHMTGNCIGSIREHTKLPYEIILVVNGKTDIYKQAFARQDQTKADKLVELEENKGYAYGVNYGIRVAKGEYIAIINNDVLVFDNWLEDMQEALTQVDLVMASPMYGEPYSRAVEAKEKRNKLEGKPLLETFGQAPDDFSCVLTRKSLFKEVGTFDEQFFMYYEDLDFKKRMIEANKKYAVTRKVNTTHIIGATDIPDKAGIMDESKRKFNEKWQKDSVL